MLVTAMRRCRSPVFSPLFGVTGTFLLLAARRRRSPGTQYPARFHGGLSGPDGRWVAVGGNNRIAYSNDGINWVYVSVSPGGGFAAISSFLHGVAYGDGMWVVVANFGRMMRSTEPSN